MANETLGAVFNKVGNFSLDSFDGRLIVQKTIYMLQAFGLNIGYHFSWYLNGPYSTSLTVDAFDLNSDSRCLAMDLPLPTPAVKKRFEDYLKFMDDKKFDARKLETIASVHFLKKRYPRMSDEEILRKLHETHSKKTITLDEVKLAVDELNKYSLL